jgi:hypothetical protein
LYIYSQLANQAEDKGLQKFAGLRTNYEASVVSLHTTQLENFDTSTYSRPREKLVTRGSRCVADVTQFVVECDGFYSGFAMLYCYNDNK